MRDELVDAAEALLAERGTADAVTVADVVRRVGVTAPVLYAHFADKDALFVAVHGRRMADFRATLRRATRGGGNPLEELERRGRAYIRYATTKPEAYAALFMSKQSLGGNVFADPATRELTAFDDLVAHVQQCMDDGSAVAGDAELVARVVWAQVHGLASLLIMMPEIVDGVGRQQLIDRLLRGITASLRAG